MAASRVLLILVAAAASAVPKLQYGMVVAQNYHPISPQYGWFATLTMLLSVVPLVRHFCAIFIDMYTPVGETFYNQWK